MPVSFYDLDYIIEINQKRLEEYTSLYQKVLERLTNIILIYSALGIFLVPITQHLFDGDMNSAVFYYITAVVFLVLLLVSVIYVIKLLLPVEIAYLDHPKRYYETYRNQMENVYPNSTQLVDKSLKGAYIFELDNAIDNNSKVFRKKNSFYYNALILHC